MMEETTVQSDILSFGNIIDNYVNYISQQHNSTPLIVTKLNEIYKEQTAGYENFIDENDLKSSAVDSETISAQELSIPQEKIAEYNKHYMNIKAIHFIKNGILETQFVDCTTRFDSFLLNLIRRAYIIHPEILTNNEKTISYKSLLLMDSIDGARNSLINEILDELFRGSHISQLEYIKKTFKLDIKKDIGLAYKNFIEITEKRNILIHCEGKVSKQYLNICNENGISISAAEGTRQIINESYFTQSCDTLLEMSLKIGYSMWKKQAKSEKDEADNYLIKVCNELIQNEKYKLAISIIDYALNFEPRPNSLLTHRFKIYKLCAYKILGETEELNKGLSEDWSSVKNFITMSLCVLKGEVENAIVLMKKMGNDPSEIDQSLYYNSVVFREFIKRDDFKETFKEVYGLEFTYKRSFLNL